MTPYQGLLWNALTDDWQYSMELRVVTNHTNALQYMASKGIIERLIVPGEKMHLYRLPQPVESATGSDGL